MAKRSLADLKKQLDDQQKNNQKRGNAGGFYYPIWNLPKDGETRIRIMEDPNEDNPLIYHLNYFEHSIEIDGKWERIPCPRTWEQHAECPFCSLSQKMYSAGKKDVGKYYYRSLYKVLRGLVTKDGLQYEEGQESSLGKVRAFKFSYQLAKKLESETAKMAAEADEDDAPFWDMDEGVDFIIQKIVEQGEGGKEYPKYDLGSGFARKPKAIPAKLLENVDMEKPLSDLLPKQLSYDELVAKLEAHNNVVSGNDDSGDDNTQVTTDDDIAALIQRNRGSGSEEKVEDKVEDTPKQETKAESNTSDDVEDALSSIEGDSSEEDDDEEALRKLLEG